MESWYFDSMDKGYVSNETISPSDSISRSKNVLMGWELKPPFSYENSILVPSQESVENHGFSDVGIEEMIRRQYPQDSMRNVFNSNASIGDIISPSVVTSNAISGDEESSSKLSSSVVDSNSRESSLFDLKLGGFGDNPNSNSPRTAPILSSPESSTPAKRVRATSLSSQTAYCQVYGCNKNLSSAKDYHKRHKVCDVHSKTAKVIVNGIEQRFCQQCSRFHLLAEFDDGKRSCRKRLAGHNERRRKPQVSFNGSRTGRTLHSYTGSAVSKLQGTTLAATSFTCQDILGPSHNEKYATNCWGKHIKFEDGADYEKTVLPPYLSGKQYSPVMDNLNTGEPRSVFRENVNQDPHGIISCSLFHANSLGSEDLSLFDAASTIQELPGISESGCALSLLSSQSRDSSGHSIVPSSGPHYSMSEVSEKLFGVGSQGLTGGIHNGYASYKVNSDFEHGFPQGSGFMNVKDQLSCEDGTTIDLLQLSSQLQRVENQRQSGLVEQENEGFCCLRMT